MGLYLCVFDGEDDVDGVDVGGYADFNALREHIVRQLEGGTAGSRFPTLVLHSDCDGEWSVEECRVLREELATIASELRATPAVQMASDWQRSVAKSIGLVPRNAFESFVDVDGEPLIQRLQELVDGALRRGRPITFQ